jgi:hypothetical protein
MRQLTATNGSPAHGAVHAAATESSNDASARYACRWRPIDALDRRPLGGLSGRAGGRSGFARGLGSRPVRL